MNPPSAIRHPQSRILVRGVNWLGDAVMTTPALMRLRERFPEAAIALFTPEKLADLWRHHPALTETLSFAPGEGLFAAARRLRAGRFDQALILPNSPRSALEAWLARIPQRLGYARPWRNWFLTQAVPSRPGAMTTRKRSVREIQELIAAPPQTLKPKAKGVHAHQIHDYLHLTAAFGASAEPLPPQLAVSADELAAVRTKFGIGPTALLFGLNAGAEYGPAKRWPAERFIEAAREIQKRTACTWLIFGGAADASLAAEIHSAIRPADAGPSAMNLAGRTSLRELMALLKLCRVLLTNDTGPMHLAAALGTSVIVPFGSTSPDLTGPGLPGDPRHRLIQATAPCAPCFLRECPIDFRCMRGIEPERVVEAVREIVGSF